MSITHSPEVVHKQVEDAQNDDQHDGAPLCLESYHNHDASNQTKDADGYPPEAPVTSKDEANKEENKQDSTRELEIHFTVLLVNLRQTGGCELLAHPAVGQDHEQSAHDGEVAQEEVEVEDEPVAKSLHNDNANQTADGIVCVFAADDQRGAADHGNDIGYEEEMGYAARYCLRIWSVERSLRGPRGMPTFAVVVQIGELIAPLRYDA